MRARILGLVILVMLVPAAHAAAQPAGTLANGSRVRLEAASVSPHPMTGTVVAFDETTLKLRTDNLSPPVVVPRDAISKLDVMVSRRSNWKLGAAIGGAVGLFAGVTATPSCSGSGFCVEFDPLLVGAFTGALSAGAGALIGLLSGKETWAPVVSGPKLSMAASRKGGVVSLSFPF